MPRNKAYKLLAMLPTTALMFCTTAMARAPLTLLNGGSLELANQSLDRAMTALMGGCGLLAALVGVALFLRQRDAAKIKELDRQLREAQAQKDAAYEINRILEAQRRAEEARHRDANLLGERDELTGIYNKYAFYQRAREVLNQNPDECYLMIRGDIDRFKIYNDLYGTKAGDQLLIEIAAMLRQTVLPGMLYCRLEGDHFALFCEQSILSVPRMLEKIDSWFDRYPSDFRFNACFGIYVVDDPSIDVGLMCDRALLALRTIKGKYGQRYAYYDEMLRDRLMLEQEMVSSMTVALTQGEFEVYFQPQYRYSTNELIGAEALVRWKHPVKGMISPAVFIPIFEKNGFISSLDQYVWEESCRCLRRWIKQKGCHPVPVSVNISRMDIENDSLPQILCSLIERYEIPAQMLKLEITESAYVENPVRLIGMVEQLKKSGFSVQMDDFGSGYSSLNTLKDVPVDLLKLDLKFLGGEHNIRGGNILSSVVRMARWLDLPVIAEGVETREQADFLCSIGCDRMQGYLFSPPMPTERFEALLVEQKAEPEQLLGAMPPISHDALIDANGFWDPGSQAALIFNSFVGGAAILEYIEGRLEALRINDRYFETIGATREEYEPIRRDILQRIWPEDRPLLLDTLSEAIVTGEESECEFRSKPMRPSVDGLWIKFRVRLLAHKGDSCLFYALIENVSPQRALEQQLEAIMTSVPGGIALYEVGERARTIYFNDATASMSGHTREEYQALYGENALAVVYDEDVPIITEKIEQLRAGGTGRIVCTYRIKYGMGGVRWIRLSGAVMRREDDLTFVSAIFFDVTDELAQQQELEHIRYGSAIMSIFDEILEIDHNTRYCLLIQSKLSERVGAGMPFEEINARWLPRVDVRDRANVKQFLRIGREEFEPRELVYRLQTANGSEAWCLSMLFRVDKRRYLCCSRDVTRHMCPAESTAEESVLTHDQERYRLIVEKMGAAVFDWDFTHGLLYHSKRYQGYALMKQNPEVLTKSGPDSQAVFKDDFLLAERFFAELRDGRAKAEITLRLAVGEEFRWSRLSVHVLSRVEGRIGRMIGWIEDVQEQREQEIALRVKAEFDSVTKLYNRATAVERISHQLQRLPECQSALLILIDVDNFKRINDGYGHLTGDRLLSSIGALIRSSVRESDLVGRMGGDEFIMLLTQIPLETAIDKLQVLEQKIHQLAKKNSIEDIVSVSIGICQTHDADGSFDDAFEKADRALYRAKNQGKDRIGVYRLGEHV